MAPGRWIVLVVASSALVACTSPSASRERFVISGSVELTGNLSDVEVDGEFAKGQPCGGRQGFADVAAGAQVVVTDENGSIVGKSSLEDGTVSLAHRTGLAGTCSLGFEVEVEPSAFYELQVANRNGPTYSQDELEQQDWTVSLNISS